MKKLILWKLSMASRLILKKYKPRVVGITGSIGKTSVKEAAFAVAAEGFRARTNIKNYNNEYGLPFTIIGQESPRRNIFKWATLFLKAWKLILFPSDYPEVLVLEMGIDKPGDMEELLNIVTPDIAVLTTVGISHLQYFGTKEVVLREKSKIFSKMNSQNTAILNFDDEKVKSLDNILPAKIISYGKNSSSNVKIISYRGTFSNEKNCFGTECEISWSGHTQKIFLKNVLGFPPVSAAAAGAAVGISLGMDAEKIRRGMENFKAQPGRMRIVEGINGSLLIDDTYNAAPLSTTAALNEFAQFDSDKFEIKKRVVILGSMVELGDESDSAHEKIGEVVRASRVDVFVGVGDEMKKAKSDFWFSSSSEAISKAIELAEPGTLFLVKGSQAKRMEKVSLALLKNKEKAKESLPRQDDYWLKK